MLHNIQLMSSNCSTCRVYYNILDGTENEFRRKKENVVLRIPKHAPADFPSKMNVFREDYNAWAPEKFD